MNIPTTLKNACLGFIFLIPFIPLYVANNLFFPFITGKAFAFRILVEIAVALWVLLVLHNRKYAPRFSWMSIGVLAFTIAVFVADMAGMSVLRSLWSNSERMEGWVTIVHLWAYFLLLTSLFGTGAEGKHMWHRYFNITIVAAILVGFYGMFQLFGWAEIHQGSSRIDASLGNAAYMAVYMLIHVFLALYLSFYERAKRKMGLSWTYMAIAAFFTFILFETATRGTILGLVGGLMLALALYTLFGKGEPTKSRGTAFGVIILIILLGVGLVAAKNTSFVKNHEALNRLASISISDTQTQARAYIWPMAIKGTFENTKTALIGRGQENFNYIFNDNYNPKMWNQEQWFDRAHSVFLDWLVAGGLVGLILYVSLFVLSIVSIWKTDHLHFIEKCILTGLLVAYAVHNIFVFDNLISYIMFFTVIGFTHSMGHVRPIRWLDRAPSQTENAIVVRDYIFLPIVVILLLGTLYVINVRPLQANTRLIAAMTACSGGGNPSSQLFARALDLDVTIVNQEIREQLIGCAENVVKSNLPQNIKADFYTLAQKEISLQTGVIAPLDVRGYALGGSFYNSIGDWASSLPLLEKAHAFSPRKQSISFLLGTNYLNTKRNKEAITLLEQTYQDDVSNSTAASAYGSALILGEEDAKAEAFIAGKPELASDERILASYAKRNQYTKVIEGYKILISKDPGNIQLYGTLTAVYLQSGRTDLAIAELQGLKTKFPTAVAQIDAAIKEIRTGKSNVPAAAN